MIFAAFAMNPDEGLSPATDDIEDAQIATEAPKTKRKRRTKREMEKSRKGEAESAQVSDDDSSLIEGALPDDQAIHRNLVNLIVGELKDASSVEEINDVVEIYSDQIEILSANEQSEIDCAVSARIEAVRSK